jgi:lipopolysaccharide biosynthesis glycosyltransferase
VAICSLLDHNPQEHIRAFVINEDIQPGTWNQLQTITSRYACDLVDVKISDRDIVSLATPHHLTRETYYRLFIPEKLQLKLMSSCVGSSVTHDSCKVIAAAIMLPPFQTPHSTMSP